MDSGAVVKAWQMDGFVILPGLFSSGDLAAVGEQLPAMFPTAEGFHTRSDPRWERFVGDEFAGIDHLPFTAVEVSLLAVHRRLVELAELLLGQADLRLYTAEAWAKYSGANDYGQWLHRDYLNHTLLGPDPAPGSELVEMFVYLTDVPEDLGPPHLVSRRHTADLPARPNWFPPGDGEDPDGGFVATTGRPDLYHVEVSAAGPAGTVVAFTPSTVHRGTNLTRPGGVRYSMQVGYRPATVEWAQRYAWTQHSHDPGWYELVRRATPRQLALFGFPPPGDPYWTPDTLTQLAQRYPDLDTTPWQATSDIAR